MGSDPFLQSGDTTCLRAANGTTLTSGGTIADDPAASLSARRGYTAGATLPIGRPGGTVVLAGTGSSYAGAILVQAGTLRAGAADAFSSYSDYTVAGGATLDLGGANQALGSLAGGGAVTSSAAGAMMLMVGTADSSTTFSGTIATGRQGDLTTGRSFSDPTPTDALTSVGRMI